MHGLQKQIDELAFRHPILWLYLPEHAPFVGQCGERLSVYHCIDEWSVGAHGYKRRTVAALERDLVCRVDVVFANSRLTAENKRRWNTNTHRIPSGADVRHFAPSPQDISHHPELAQLSHPILAFAGNINEKIDVNLLAAIARQRPEWSLVIAGRYNPRAVDMSELERLRNVHYLGELPFADVPSVLLASDVCLLPYVQGEATRFRSPLKLYEYLATGKPVVSTPHPEVDEIRDLVTIAPADHFVDAIERTLAGDTAEKSGERMAIAAQHSWDARVDAMATVLAEHLR